MVRRRAGDLGVADNEATEMTDVRTQLAAALRKLDHDTTGGDLASRSSTGPEVVNVPPDHKSRNRCAMHPMGMTALTPDNPFRAGHPHWTAMRRVGKKAAGRELDGRTWDEYPQAVPHG